MNSFSRHDERLLRAISEPLHITAYLAPEDLRRAATQLIYRGSSRLRASVSYRPGSVRRSAARASSISGTAVIAFSYELPYQITAGTVTQLASARPFNATTGLDNNGDGVNNDRPVVDGGVIAKSAFRGTGTSDVSLFVEGRVKLHGRQSVLLRLEGFNLFTHANVLGRAQTIYGDTTTPNATFGQLVAVGTAATALPSLATIDPPRMFQLQVRYVF